MTSRREAPFSALKERKKECCHYNYIGTGRVPHRSTRNFKPCPPSYRTLISLCHTLILLLSLRSFSIICEASNFATDELTNDSVILITGASTPIASHLALALCNTFQARLLLVDSLSLHTYQSHLDQDDVSIPLKVRHQFQEVPKESHNLNKKWAKLEHDRQRLSHVLSTCGTLARFYRVDFRTVPPQYAHEGESHVNFLQTLLKEEDITHVVHFEQEGVGADRAVFKSHHLDIKLDTMESILHEFLSLKDSIKSHTKVVPHLTYASSSQVYAPQMKSTPMDTTIKVREDDDIQVSKLSTMGTRHLVQEVLARKYAELYGIYSIGLRFFQVYGEWSSPHNALFQFAENVVLKSGSPVLAAPIMDQEDNGGCCWWKEERDYIHVDDAVDALLAAMQFRPPSLLLPGQSEEEGESIDSSLVINVGSGKGTTLTDIASIMEEFIPPNNGMDVQSIISRLEADSRSNTDQVISSRVASVERARILLGFEPRITLEEGVLRLVTWHNDRAFPYQDNPNFTLQERNTVTEKGPKSIRRNLDQVGITACSPLQTDCHSSLVVVPCVSECSHFKSCLPSLYDDVAIITRYLTQECDSARYTVVWDWAVTLLPSIIGIQNKSRSKSKNCNLALIPEDSKLYQAAKKRQRKPHVKTTNDADHLFHLLKKTNIDGTNRSGILREIENVLLFHDEWTLVPLSVPDKEALEHMANWTLLKDLPKYSPGQFFAPSVKYAFYRQPDIPFPTISIRKLVTLMRLPPTHDIQKDFTTVLLLTRPTNASKVDNIYAKSCDISVFEETKKRWYTAVRIALGKHMKESSPNSFDVSPPWMGHDLLSADGHELRCDIYSELWRWKDNAKLEKERGAKDVSLEFIATLHNFWSSMMEIEKGSGVWWESNRSAHDADSKRNRWENYAVLSHSERAQSFVRVAPSDIIDRQD